MSSRWRGVGVELTGTGSVVGGAEFWSANVKYTQLRSCVGAYNEELVSTVASDAMLGTVVICPGAMHLSTSRTEFRLQISLHCYYAHPVHYTSVSNQLPYQTINMCNNRRIHVAFLNHFLRRHVTNSKNSQKDAYFASNWTKTGTGPNCVLLRPSPYHHQTTSPFSSGWHVSTTHAFPTAHTHILTPPPLARN